jgi:pentatricopeptide repeat protein
MSTAVLCETPRRQTSHNLHGSLSVFNLSDRLEISDLDHSIRTRQADKAWSLFSTIATRDEELIPLTICHSLYALLSFAKKLGGSGKSSQTRQHQLDQLLAYVQHNHSQHESRKDFLASVQEIPLPAYKKLKRDIRFGCKQSAWKAFFHMHKRNPDLTSKLTRNTCLDLMMLLMDDESLNENQLKKRLEIVALYGAGKKMVESSGRTCYLSASDMLRVAQICFAYKKNQSPDQLILEYITGLKKKKLRLRGDSLDELVWRMISNNDLARARHIVDTVKKVEDIDVNESVYVNMMDSYRRQRCYHDALLMFEQLLESSQTPTARAYNVALQIFAEQGAASSPERANYIFESMIRWGIKPDVATYTEMIRVHGGNLKMCQQLYSKMQQYNIKPNVYTYNALIESASKKKDVKSVLRWFQTMVDQDVQPNQIVLSNVLKCLSAQYKKYPNASEAVLQIASQASMAGIKADAALYTILLKMQADTVGIEGALDIHRDMLSNSVEPNAYTYTILIHTCGKNKIPDTAQQIFNLMRQSKRHSPNTVTYTAMMNVWQKAQRRDKVNQLSLEFLKACKSDKTGRFWVDKRIREFIHPRPCICESYI